MPTVQDLVNLLAMQDQQQGAANARINPSTLGWGVQAPAAQAAGLARLPAAFSPAEMAQWDQQQGFHSEMAGGRPMWVAPGTANPASGAAGDMNYQQWQYARQQPGALAAGLTPEGGRPMGRPSVPLQGAEKESRDRVAGNAAAARIGIAMDAAKKKDERTIASKSQAIAAATDPVSQRARANEMRRSGMPMDQALARQQMLGWGDGQINPMAAEIAMPGVGGRMAIAQQEQQNQQANANRDFGLRKSEMDAKIAATQGAAYKTTQEMGPKPDAATDPAGAARWDARNAQNIAAGNAAGPAMQQPGSFTPVSGPGANPYDRFDPATRQQHDDWNAEQAGQLTPTLIDAYDKLYQQIPLGMMDRAAQAMGVQGPNAREKIISAMTTMTGKPRAAIEKWYDFKYPRPEKTVFDGTTSGNGERVPFRIGM